MFPVSNNSDLLWVKSSRSTGNGQCVEVAAMPGCTVMRDSKDPGGPVLQFHTLSWRQFVDAVRVGEFDLPA
jgi:hypothetical protein